MGQIKYFTPFLIIILLMISVLRWVNSSDQNDILFKIYQVEDQSFTGFFYKIIRKIPAGFSDCYDIKKTEFKNHTLFNLRSTYSASLNKYLYIKFIKSDKEGFLYAPEFFRARTIQQNNPKLHYSAIIDSALFQLYYKELDVTCRDSIVKTYINLFKNAVTTEPFQTIHSPANLNRIIDTIGKYHSSHKIFYDTTIFNFQEDSKRYYYFFGIGIFELTIEPDNNINIVYIAEESLGGGLEFFD